VHPTRSRSISNAFRTARIANCHKSRYLNKEKNMHTRNHFGPPISYFVDCLKLCGLFYSLEAHVYLFPGKTLFHRALHCRIVLILARNSRMHMHGASATAIISNPHKRKKKNKHCNHVMCSCALLKKQSFSASGSLASLFTCNRETAKNIM
jgi:hypothetical protein